MAFRPSGGRFAQVAGNADDAFDAELDTVDTAGGYSGTKPKFTWTPPGRAPIAPEGTSIAMRMQNLGLTTAPQELDANSAGRLLAGLSPQEFYGVQQQLYARGLFPDTYYGKTPRPVNWGSVGDNDTLSAFRSAAGLAGFTGNLDQILGGPPSAQALLAGQGAGRERAPLVIELPSAEDLNAVLRQSASTVLGRDPTPEELSEYVADFQAGIAAYQREAYGKATGGGTVNQPPSAGVAAESFLREKAPTEAGAQKMEQGLGVLLRMFGGGS